MAIVSTKQILQKARNGGYAVGAFNVYNMETIQAVVSAANARESPVILAVTEASIEYAGVDYIVALARTAVNDANVPVSLHLDHGKNLNTIRACIKAGFTSVMIDGSRFPIEENMAITRKVVNIAHERNVTVEGELGKIAGIEDSVISQHAILTDPDEAREFVKKTRIDSLAVAIGTSHGAYKFRDKVLLDFDRLKKVREKVSIPLVLHGASEIPPALIEGAGKCGMVLNGAKGVDAKSIKKACKLGICKINIDTDLRITHTQAVREFISINPQIFDPRKISAYARDAVKMMVMSKIELFGSKHKA
jgi:fructose-bisphosphate aldolase, class II